MKNILFPFDGSAPAQRALDYLVGLAKERPGAQVHVLNVLPSPETYGSNAIAREVVERITDSAKERSAEICRQAASRLEAAGVACAIHPGVGHVLDAVERTIKQEGCDIVVMGTRGMGGLGNLLMGSVATQVVHSVSVPVLLVK